MCLFLQSGDINKGVHRPYCLSNSQILICQQLEIIPPSELVDFQTLTSSHRSLLNRSEPVLDSSLL
jgi:hypothetical protein